MSPLEISRGCPFRCRYCQTPRLFGNKMRHRSIDSIVKYAKYYRDLRLHLQIQWHMEVMVFIHVWTRLKNSYSIKRDGRQEYFLRYFSFRGSSRIRNR
ncbi:MAG: radical SAM protein [Methanolobus sp.]